MMGECVCAVNRLALPGSSRITRRLWAVTRRRPQHSFNVNRRDRGEYGDGPINQFDVG
jgi:hypothetical protein